MMKPLPFAAVAALSVLLSACFVSQEPKFPLSSAVAAFGNGGQYGVYEHAAGKYQRQGPMTVKRQSDGSYLFETDKKPVSMSFHDVGNGVLVGQARPDDKKNYGYVIVTRKEAEFFFHTPQCDEQDPALLAAHRVAVLDKYSCSIDAVTDPAKLFAALPAGNPNFKFVPE